MIAVAILATIVGAAIWNMTTATDGSVTFSLDDPYIHLAMARAFAEHGTWGITPGTFSATSSSPLYLLLLSLGFLLGSSSAYWAWFFTVAGGLVVAMMLAKRVTEAIPNRKVALLVSVLLIIGVGLPEMMMSGMEHTLHIVAVLAILILLERRLDSNSRDYRTDLPLAASLLVAASLRYETLFLIAPLSWVLWQKGLRRGAMMVAGAGIIPAVVLGSYQLLHGAMALPNSIALKGVMINGDYFAHLTSFRVLVTTPEVLMMLIATAVWWFDTIRKGHLKPSTAQLLSLVFFSAVILHGAFAKMERRYIGYLLAMGFWTLLPAFVGWFRDGAEIVARSGRSGLRNARQLAAVVVVIVLVVPFLDRTWELRRLALVGQDIYSQQIQLSRFLSTYYPGEPIGLNDIGTTAWAGENPILDFWGLGSNEVAKMRMHEELTPEQMNRLARDRGVKVVAIYSHWFLREKGIPEHWVLVGRWQIPSGLMTNAASNAVDFFATSPDVVEPLRANLQRFEPRLPAAVKLVL